VKAPLWPDVLGEFPHCSALYVQCVSALEMSVPGSACAPAPHVRGETVSLGLAEWGSEHHPERSLRPPHTLVFREHLKYLQGKDELGY